MSKMPQSAATREFHGSRHSPNQRPASLYKYSSRCHSSTVLLSAIFCHPMMYRLTQATGGVEHHAE
jgi:hypothetical protein